MLTDKKIYTKQIQVTNEHLDQNNHVNNVQFVYWVEEIAAEHWEILKHETAYATDYWLLFDHHIQYKKQVYLGETLTIKTYPLPPEGIKQPRKVEFYRHDELVVDSRTRWVLFDNEKHRVKRIESDWLEK
ncbi:acyl-CoA thioesterase [Parapedobacter indicus]|uniref:Acyl-CoA thioester hydrolase n=1 Tax=Parapedobacter indicus TaxID=1477437 RepID=A0A1I3CFS2_9SPHI|nr:acyl-CoA thioesterase [Parapedobacter indicus]PPL04232.1 acyl-CoA thioester hydrolase [Parapedobacter indicus]SFH73400.1 acyl-CoA thioester hydrolase [Parapedobacter indicus]